ncbi:MAG: alpha/beta fold hydrolase [Spirulinaceae cyanobacterium]
MKSQQNQTPNRLFSLPIVKLIGSASTFLIALTCAISPAAAAERLILRLGPFERSVAVKDLEEFANTGKIPPSLRVYSPVLTPQIGELLSRQLQVDPSVADKFIEELLSSADGDRLLSQLKTALPESSIEQLKAGIYLALRQANGISAISFLQAYPEEELVVDATAAASIALQFNTANLQSQMLAPLLEKELKVDNQQQVLASLPKNIKPQVVGSDQVSQTNLILEDEERKRAITAEIYYSEEESRGPLVVMSHGFASNRFFLDYLAKHLASHGFTVVSLDHPGSDIESIAEISLGLGGDKLLPASEFIERPQDITFLLDELEEMVKDNAYAAEKINTEEVAIIGHSLGGYTALALAGGELDLKGLESFCANRTPLGRSPADWLQCAAANLAEIVGKDTLSLKDERIVRGIALNPLVGQLFGEKGLEKINQPFMILTGTEDGITPSVDHQLRPFKKLPGEKYLLVAVGATHMSVNDLRNLNSEMGQSTLVKEVMGEEAEPVRQLLRGMSLAFLNQETSEASTYQAFLEPAYVQSYSSPTIKMRMTTKLPNTLDAWLTAVNLGGEGIVTKAPQKPRPQKFASRFFAKFSNLFAVKKKKIMPQARNCNGELDSYLDEMLHDYDRRGLS